MYYIVIISPANNVYWYNHDNEGNIMFPEQQYNFNEALTIIRASKVCAKSVLNMVPVEDKEKWD